MKALWAILLTIGFLSGLLSPAGIWAREFKDVLSTPHNLASKGKGTSVNDACLNCHIEPAYGTPKDKDKDKQDKKDAETAEASPPDETAKPGTDKPAISSAVKPLWDLKNPTEVFTISQGSPSEEEAAPSEKKALPGRPTGCLECHDGTVGKDLKGFDEGEGGFQGGALHGGNRSPNHPVDVLYPRRPSGEFVGDQNNPNMRRYWSIPDRAEDGMVLPTGPVSDNLGLRDIDPNDPKQAAQLVHTFSGLIRCETCHDPHNNEVRPFLRATHKTLCLICHQR